MELRRFASRYLLLLRLLRAWRAFTPAGFRPNCVFTLTRHLNPYQTLAWKIAVALGDEFPERPSRLLWNEWLDNHTRFVMDFLDYDAVTPRWVEKNVEIANPECVAQIRQTGGLLLTYHTHHQNTLCCILGELGIRISPIGAAPEESPLYPLIGKWARRVNADSEKHFRGGSYLFTNDLRKLTRQMHAELRDRHVVLSLCDFHQPESASPRGTTLRKREISPPVGAIQTALKNETPVYVAYLGKVDRKLRLDMARLQTDGGIPGVVALYLRYLEQRIQASPPTWQGWEWFGNLPPLKQGHP